jgi:adenylate cyclase
VAETRKLAAIVAFDMVGYSRLAGADEERILARLRALQRSDRSNGRKARHQYRAEAPAKGLDLGSPIGEAGRLSVEVAAVMPRIAVPS